MHHIKKPDQSRETVPLQIVFSEIDQQKLVSTIGLSFSKRRREFQLDLSIPHGLRAIQNPRTSSWLSPWSISLENILNAKSINKDLPFAKLEQSAWYAAQDQEGGDHEEKLKIKIGSIS